MSGRAPPTVDYLRGRRSDPRPYIPLIGSLAASVNQIPAEIFLSNATQQANAIQSAYRLFEPDAVVTGVDTTLVAEALGADVEWNDDTERFETADPVASPDDAADPTTAPERGRLSTVTEVGERLATTLDDAAVVGVVPGPLTTFEATYGKEVALATSHTKPVRTAIGELGRAFGKAGVDAILVYEEVERLGENADAADVTVETLEVLGNITGFYDTPLMIAPNGYAESTVDAVLDRASPAAVLLDTDDPAARADEHPDVRVGGSITADLLAADPKEIRAMVAERTGDFLESVFLASGRQLPSGVHPNALHAVRKGATES